MGHVPPPQRPTSAAHFLAMHERKYLREIERRTSWLPWRRRRALSACAVLTKARLAVLGLAADPWLIRAPEPVALPSPVNALPIAPDPDLVLYVERI